MGGDRGFDHWALDGIGLFALARSKPDLRTAAQTTMQDLREPRKVMISTAGEDGMTPLKSNTYRQSDLGVIIAQLASTAL